MTAERWLLKESRNESVVFDSINILLLESSFTSTIPQRQLVVTIQFLSILIFGHIENAIFLLFFLPRERFSFHFTLWTAVPVKIEYFRMSFSSSTTRLFFHWHDNCNNLIYFLLSKFFTRISLFEVWNSFAKIIREICGVWTMRIFEIFHDDTLLLTKLLVFYFSLQLLRSQLELNSTQNVRIVRKKKENSSTMWERERENYLFSFPTRVGSWIGNILHNIFGMKKNIIDTEKSLLSFTLSNFLPSYKK